MNKDKYFAMMRETSEAVFPYMMKCLGRIKDIDADLYSLMMFVVDKRKDKPMVRPFLVRLAYEVCGGRNWERVLPACAAFELLNISSYQANCALDNKMSVLSKGQKDSQFISSMITRELCSEMLSDLRAEFGLELVEKLERSLNASNMYIYVAQHYDLNLLNIRNYDRYRDESLFMRDYIKRCRYGVGVFSGEVGYCGALLANARPEELEALRGFGVNYGIGLQIVNDLADFLPSGERNVEVNRSYQDQLSDARNGRMTYGVYRLQAILGDGWLAHQEPRALTKEYADYLATSLVQHGIVTEIKDLAAKYGNLSRQCLGVFDNECTALECLIAMTTICDSNKYYKQFDEITERSVCDRSA